MAGAAGALRGRVVPALVVERVGDGRRAKQADDLLLAHAGLQLVDRRFLAQVALVDRLPVDDAATGNHEGDEGEEQDRKSDVEGKRVSVRVDRGGRRRLKK